MTPCDDCTSRAPGTSGGTTSTRPCSCGDAELSVNPFTDLRVGYGMLLGQDDFDVLMGNPRGKEMLHSAWMHGAGAIWGCKAHEQGTREIAIDPGLLSDGLGRLLFNPVCATLDVTDYVGSRPPDDDDCGSRVLDCFLVACFGSCDADPVPVLADPCDAGRQSTDYSRVLETVTFELRPHRPARSTTARGYALVRAFLGLAPLPENGAGKVRRAWRRVAAADEHDRPLVMRQQLDRLAARDSVALAPVEDTGDRWGDIFPSSADRSCVVLAGVRISVRDENGCDDIQGIELDNWVRDVVLPVETLQELVCGLAPGVLGASGMSDAGGPRVIGSRTTFSGDRLTLTIPVRGDVARGSLRGAVDVTSINLDRGGWVNEDIDTIDLDTSGPDPVIVVTMADRPVNDLVRVVVRGTGRRPVLGTDGTPLAGTTTDPPATRTNGRDAVIQIGTAEGAAQGAGG